MNLGGMVSFWKKSIGVLGLAVTLLAGCFGWFSMGVDAYAAETPEYRIQVSPATLDLDLTPGKTFTTSYRVQNTGTKKFDFEISVAPYSVTDETYNTDFAVETQYTDIVNWVSFSETKGTLEPGKEQEITVMIKVPQDVPAGGQYGIILSKIADDQSAGEGTGVTIVRQVGLILYSNVDGKTRIEGKIEENKVPSFLFNPPITATSVIANTGNTHVEAEYVLQVFPLFSDEEVFTNEENPVKRKILPETRRYNELSWSGAPKLGIFRVRQTIKAFGKTSTTEKLVFLCPIWFLFIIVLILFCVVFWIVSRVRNRRRV